MATTVNMTYIDSDGEKATHEMRIESADAVVDDSDLLDLMEATQALVSPQLDHYNILDADSVDGAPAAVNGAYSSRDRLRIGMKTAAGNRLVFSVPAPVAELFTGDDVVINTPGSAVANLITAIIAIVRDKSGSLAATYTGGTRVRNQ